MVKGYGKGKFKSDRQRKAVMGKISKPKKSSGRYKVVKIKENNYAIKDKKREKVFVGFSKEGIDNFNKSSTKEKNELMDALYVITS